MPTNLFIKKSHFMQETNANRVSCIKGKPEVVLHRVAIQTCAKSCEPPLVVCFDDPLPLVHTLITEQATR